MPFTIWNFIILFGVVLIVLTLLKRPLYEAMALAFVVLLTVNGLWANAFDFLYTAARSSIIFTIILFLIFAAILKETGIIHDCIDIILALVGNIPGGAGIVSLISSAFMGAMSGSGPGNVAATGSITIPLMKEAGYSPEFAAGIAMSGACLAPVIPPSATILSAFSCLAAVKGFEDYAVSDLWVVMYAVGAVFVVHRIIQFYIMYAALGVHNTAKTVVPDLKQAWKKGRKSIIVVLVIIIPFAVDSLAEDWIILNLGLVGAENFSNSILFFTPAVAVLYSILVCNKNKGMKLKSLLRAVETDLKPICSLVAVLFFSYAISALLGACDTVGAVEIFLASLNLSKPSMVLLAMLFMTLIGMFMSGTSLIPLLGPVYISIFASYGISPVLTAALIPVLFVSLGQMTPPFAVCMFAAMGIAESDFKKTSTHAIIWSVVQFALVALMLLGVVPILGT